MIEFEDRLQRCYLCKDSWFKKNTLISWYKDFNSWVSSGECTAHRAGIEPFKKVVPAHVFYPCLWEYLETNFGILRKMDILFTDDALDERTHIRAFRFILRVKKIDSTHTQGRFVITDVYSIEDEYALEGTYSFNSEYLDYELDYSLESDILNSLSMSIAAVILIVLLMTASLTATLLVAFSILIV